MGMESSKIFHSKMTEQNTLIQCVNKLHDIFSDLGVNADFDLPQIAVVGSQSAGKSSVLENLVGWDFLPRGTGIVTRCPLILQMLIGPEKYGKFSHSEEKFTNFAEIRTEIENRTETLSGGNKGISEVPINLKIYSPDFLDLTLVDLPGLTRNPTGGQPDDIEQQIENMIVEYIQKDSCLILAVSPANSDLANSDALKLARKVDPNGKRTIGVLTKLDIMDKGTNARDIFLGRAFSLPRGYIGVVSRSQSEINAGKGIDEAIKKEKQFFESHDSYRDLAHQMGTTYLQRKLNGDLAKHIREKLPEFREKILDKKKTAEITLRNCPKVDLRNGGYNELHKIVNELNVKMMNCIKGTTEVIPDKQQVGTKIHYLFHDKLEEDFWAEVVDEQKIYNEITIAIKNMKGIQQNLYASDEVFLQITKNLILGKAYAMEQCLDNVVQELHQFCTEIVDEIVENSFRPLAVKVKEIIFSELATYNDECLSRLEEILQEESSYINVKHFDFETGDNPSYPEILMKGPLKINSEDNWGEFSSTNCLTLCKLPMKDSLIQKMIIEKVTITHNSFFLTDKNVKISSLKFNAWKDAFINAGVLTSNIKHDSDVDIEESEKIKQIRKHLALYMRIFTKKFLDTVPKKIKCHVVDRIVDYVNDKLFANLASEELIHLMKENPRQKEIREKATTESKVCKQALKIIDEQDAKLAFD